MGAVSCKSVRQPSERIVSVTYGNIFVVCGTNCGIFDPVIFIIDMFCFIFDTIDSLDHVSDTVIVTIIHIAYGMAITCSAFNVLHQAAGKVVIIRRLDTAFRIRHRRQRAIIIVGIGNGASIFVGFQNHPAIIIIGIGDTVAVTIGEHAQIMILCGIGIGCQCPATNLDRFSQTKRTIGKGIRGRSSLDSGEVIVCIRIIGKEAIFSTVGLFGGIESEH